MRYDKKADWNPKHKQTQAHAYTQINDYRSHIVERTLADRRFIARVHHRASHMREMTTTIIRAYQSIYVICSMDELRDPHTHFVDARAHLLVHMRTHLDFRNF